MDTSQRFNGIIKKEMELNPSQAIIFEINPKDLIFIKTLESD